MPVIVEPTKIHESIVFRRNLLVDAPRACSIRKINSINATARIEIEGKQKLWRSNWNSLDTIQKVNDTKTTKTFFVSQQ